ncbi:MAG: protein kinase [Planctomycetia bacterium]|nr:protein kinase [Planctomycetia bacterium]
MTNQPCPTHEKLSTYVHGLLPIAQAEEVTAHVAKCSNCEDTVHGLNSASSDSLLERIQAPAAAQPYVDEPACRKVVESLKRNGPPPDGTQQPGAQQHGAQQHGAQQQSSATGKIPSSSDSKAARTMTRTEFVEFITTIGFVSTDELTVIDKQLPPDKTDDVQTLAQALVQQGKLTKFQAATVYQGKGKSLVFGDYVVIDRLGAGGMGQVFKARHRRMDRIVALKVLSTAAMKSADSIKRFEREVRAAAKLIHPNIVHAYDAGAQDGVHYLVMEHVAGPDLSSLVKKQGKLDVKLACDYIAQAARGFAFAHSKGIVHRDIKPGNLLIDQDGTVKVLDMGLARFEDSGLGEVMTEGELTHTGAVMGTVDYMAPEQALNTRHADAKSDVYGLGCTLYRILTGEYVFGGDTLVEKILAHRERPVPQLRRLRPEAPAALEGLLARMLSKQPDLRPTMQDIAEALPTIDTAKDFGVVDFAVAPIAPTPAAPLPAGFGSMPGSSPSSMTIPQVRRPMTGAALPPKRGNRMPLIAAAAAGAVLLCFGVWVSIRDKSGREIARVEVPDGGTVVVQPQTERPEAIVPVGPAPSVPVSNNTPPNNPAPPLPEVVPPVNNPPTFAPTVNNPPVAVSPSTGVRTVTGKFGGNADRPHFQGSDESEPLAFFFDSIRKEVPRGTDVPLNVRTTNPNLPELPLPPNPDPSRSQNFLYVHTHLEYLDSDPAALQMIQARGATSSRIGLTSLALSTKNTSMAKHYSYSMPGLMRMSDLPVGRYRLHVVFAPMAGLGRKQEATCEFRIVDQPVDTGWIMEAAWMPLEPAGAIASINTNANTNTTPPSAISVATPAPVVPPTGNLWIYGEPFDVKNPLITVESLHYDGSTPLTIEAWTVPRPTPMLDEFFVKSTVSLDRPAFFEFSGRNMPQMKASWNIGIDRTMRRYYSSHKMLRSPGTASRLPTYGGELFATDATPALHHIAITFGRSINGQQEILSWFDGKTLIHNPPRLTSNLLYEPLDFFQSQGYIDELRISKVVRYQAHFTPQRRFTPDADTIALYHCDEGSGDRLIDSSGNNFHGKLTNPRWAPTDVATPASTSPLPIASTLTQSVPATTEFVGGSSPSQPLAFEISPLARENQRGRAYTMLIRARNSTANALPLSGTYTGSAMRHVAMAKTELRCLEPGPTALQPYANLHTMQPGIFSFGVWSMASEQAVVQSGETVTLRMPLQTMYLPVGRYAVDVVLIPGQGLGEPQKATYEFRLTDQPAAQGALPELIWTMAPEANAPPKSVPAVASGPRSPATSGPKPSTLAQVPSPAVTPTMPVAPANPPDVVSATEGQAPAPNAAGSRLPVPDAKLQQAALQLIKEVYQDDYTAARVPDKKSGFADKLLEQSRQTVEPTDRYVLINEARVFAVDGDDPAVLRRVLATIVNDYDVDAPTIYIDSWKGVLLKTRPPTVARAIYDDATAMLEAAIGRAAFDEAKRFGDYALTIAPRIGDAAAVKSTRDRNTLLAARQQEWTAAAAALAKLATAPDDSEANFLVGRYRAMVEDDWTTAFPLLAKGSDEAWKDLAAKSMTVAAEGAARAAMADAFWDASKKGTGKELAAAALYWYQAALPSLTGLQKVRIEKRIVEATAVVPARKLPTTPLGERSASPAPSSTGAAVSVPKPLVDDPRGPFGNVAYQKWLKEVAALPAQQQVDAVSKKMMELNPGFDGKLVPRIQDGVVTDLMFLSDNVSNIYPVRALSGLKVLNCSGNKPGSTLVDLTPLQGLPLTAVYCVGTGVSDLSPLRGMQLTLLSVSKTPVADLSVVQGMPLTSLNCDSTQVSDLAPLQNCKQLKSLTRIGSRVQPAMLEALKQVLPNCEMK